MNGWNLLAFAILGGGLLSVWYRCAMAFMGCYIPLRQKYGWSWKFTIVHGWMNFRQLFMGVTTLGYLWWLLSQVVQWVQLPA